VIERCDTDESCDLLAVEATELGQPDQQRRGRDAADTWD
jgi:hypothetical protein